MAQEYVIFRDFVRGVDMRRNPLSLGSDKFHYAKNLIFEEGVPKTRYGYKYIPTGIKGEFHESIFHNGGRSTSASVYAHDKDRYVMVVDGIAYSSCVNSGQSFEFSSIGDLKYSSCTNTFMESAENYVIFQNRSGNTFWWDGCELTESKGMCHCADPVDDVCDTENKVEYDKKYATFINANIVDWLLNEAGNVQYVNGRVLQEKGHIWASDPLNKRGGLSSDDILKQTESARWSFGDPISSPSWMGNMTAFVTFPSKTNATHQGDAIAFYEVGSQFIDPNQFPRQTRATAKGEIIQQGWNYKKLTRPATHIVSATGRRAAVETPDDVLFASNYGIHFLTAVAGQGSFNDETTKTLSQAVEPIFLHDTEDLLEGRQVGHWVNGNRFFVGACLVRDETKGQLPMARGMLSMNQSLTYTEDRTPIPVWEGLHTADDGIAGIHKFDDLSLGHKRGSYGFLASNNDGEIYWAKIDKDRHTDERDGEVKRIPWEAVTGRHRASGESYDTQLDSSSITVVTSNLSESLKVEVRTDKSGWVKLKEVTFNQSLEKCLFEETIQLGRAKKEVEQGAWYQYRISGLGYIELKNLVIEVSKGDKLEGKNKRHKVGDMTYDWKGNL